MSLERAISIFENLWDYYQCEDDKKILEYLKELKERREKEDDDLK